MGIPLILYFKKMQWDNRKQILQFIIANSAIIYLFILIIYIISDINRMPKNTPPFFYGYISYYLLKENIKKDINKDIDNINDK